MTELVITRGYPASGKSTWAKAQAAQPGWARVCRDDLRAMLFGGAGVLGHELEQQVSSAERAQVRALLRRGVNVVVDATHLRLKFARDWADLAVQLGVSFRVKDFRDIPVAECIARDAARERTVGSGVISEMAAKFPYQSWGPVLPRTESAPVDVEPYLPGEHQPPAWLVDIDGTLAQMTGRSPYDWSQVGTDLPVAAVIRLVQQLAGQAAIIVMSGRDEVCRGLTADWLTRHQIPHNALLMRPANDSRKDSTVKAELFNKHVRHQYWVHGVIDDRLQVCRMWHQLGLPLFRVGDPDASF